MKKILQWLLIGVALMVLVACGGGGPNTAPQSEANVTLQDNVVVVSDDSTKVLNSYMEENKTKLEVSSRKMGSGDRNRK